VAIAGPFRELELEADFPTECLTKASAPAGDGLVASFSGELTAAGSEGTVTIATPTGEEVETFEAQAPIQWSPDGRYLATGSSIVTAKGREVATFEGEGAWSPSSNCVISHSETGLSVTTIEGDTTLLLERSVFGLSISPDGTRLALTLAHGPRATDVWIANLSSGVVREVDRAPREGWFARLGPWSGDGTQLYYWRPDSLLRSVQPTTPVQRTVYAPSSNTTTSRMPADDDTLIECAGNPVGVIGAGAGPTAQKNRRLAIMRADAAPEVLTPSHEFVYLYPQCSPDGFYMAAVRGPAKSGATNRHVVVLDNRGGVLQTLSSGDTTDSNPIWGPSGTGLLFVQLDSPGQGELWFAPEGHAPSATGIEITNSYAPYVTKYGFESMLDWSATPPSGRPPG
jgi:Tol biopolymer transport system component